MKCVCVCMRRRSLSDAFSPEAQEKVHFISGFAAGADNVYVVNAQVRACVRVCVCVSVRAFDRSPGSTRLTTLRGGDSDPGRL